MLEHEQSLLMADVKKTEEWKKCFNDIDEGNTGILTYDQLVVAARIANQNPKYSDIFDMFPNKFHENEPFNFDDFVYYMSNAPNPILDLRAAFRTYDTNRDGYIQRDELKGILLGDPSNSEEEIDEFLHEFDIKKDNKLDYEEFTKLLTKEYFQDK